MKNYYHLGDPETKLILAKAKNEKSLTTANGEFPEGKPLLGRWSRA